MDLKQQTEAAMKALTELSTAAKDAGDGDLMYGANRAWRELYAHETVMLKAKLAAKAS